ncbi:DUF6115 domain-containing protein [Pectinatus sottacetonis]|uniref:DUF6115 domain-containing protein n=1 Tax=Pectinatus sottacetonis TaxID=1002795 RepID=UPI0018C46C26|nr:hypothetical protein [Pectinatus sottacetonis]
MFTEILGVIIIIGIIFILILRHNTLNESANDKKINSGAVHLQKDLEKTGNEILAKMDQKMDEMELSMNKLDKKIVELKNYNALLAEYENKNVLQKMSREKKSTAATTFNSALTTATKNTYGGSIDIVAGNDNEQSTDKKENAVKENVLQDDLSETAKKVFALLNQHIEPGEISRRLSIGRGAVDMIIQMYKKNK